MNRIDPIEALKQEIVSLRETAWRWRFWCMVGWGILTPLLLLLLVATYIAIQEAR